MKGTIKFFDKKRGFGFITREDGTDLFLHISEIESFSGNYPLTGQGVEFGEIEESEKGKAAKRVVLVNQ